MSKAAYFGSPATKTLHKAHRANDRCRARALKATKPFATIEAAQAEHYKLCLHCFRED